MSVVARFEPTAFCCESGALTITLTDDPPHSFNSLIETINGQGAKQFNKMVGSTLACMYIKFHALTCIGLPQLVQKPAKY
jgi:hypothetical protein